MWLPRMTVWEFDRLGGIASQQFDINKDGLQFVSTILAFLWVNEEQLGFDPTVITENGLRFIEIQRNGTTERLIIDGLMTRARCISGRATTCWKAHRETRRHRLLSRTPGSTRSVRKKESCSERRLTRVWST